MIDNLPLLAYPNWLKTITAESMAEDEFPLSDILTDSLYYPSSWLDSDPVRHLAGNIYSFIYVDYGHTKSELDYSLENSGFRGYHIIGRRPVSEHELNPKGAKPSGVNPRLDGRPENSEQFIKPPFCEWVIFAKNENETQSSVPERFSLLYLCADGAAAFQILFTPNRIRPRAIAIIQPGDGFGYNWTRFFRPNGILARSVGANPAGMPLFLLEGSTAPLARWPYYDEFICLLDKEGHYNIYLYTTKSYFKEGHMKEANWKITESKRAKMFQHSRFTSLPNLPELTGWHMCWLTTTNPHDTIEMRIRLGYEPVKLEDAPRWESSILETGDWKGFIGFNEMLAFKLPISLYEKFMKEANHDGTEPV
jgi:hypothetical protein